MYEIKFEYREPGEDFTRSSQLSVTSPGTRATPPAALEIMKIFIEHFQCSLPVAGLERVECKLQGSEGNVFKINIGIK